MLAKNSCRWPMMLLTVTVYYASCSVGLNCTNLWRNSVQIFSNLLIPLLWLLTETTWAHLLINGITAWLITWRTLTLAVLKLGSSLVSDSTLPHLVGCCLEIQNHEFCGWFPIIYHSIPFSRLNLYEENSEYQWFVLVPCAQAVIVEKKVATCCCG